MKRSEIYREAARRVSVEFEDLKLPVRPYFFAAFPVNWTTSDYVATKAMVHDYYPIGGSDHLPYESPDICILALCFMAAIAESEES